MKKRLSGVLQVASLAFYVFRSFDGLAGEGPTPYSPVDPASPEYRGGYVAPPGLDLRTAEELAWDENRAIIDTLLHSGHKSGVQAIAEEYEIGEAEAKAKFQNAIRYFEQAGRRYENMDDMLYYPETGLKIAKSAGTASTVMLGVLSPATALMNAESTGAMVSNAGMMMAGTMSACFKLAALTEEYAAYMKGEEPDEKTIKKLNDVSNAINTSTLVGGTFVNVPTKPLDYISNLLGAATDAGTKDAATRMGTRFGKDNQAEVSKVQTKPPATVKDEKRETRNLAGSWVAGGALPARPGGQCSITQDGTQLVFQNEHGGRSRGNIVDTQTVVATDWEGGLIGRISHNGNRISWANDTFWERSVNPDTPTR